MLISLRQVLSSAPKEIRFEKLCLCQRSLPLHLRDAFDVCVDKGTLDAISLSDNREENIRTYLTNVHALLATSSQDANSQFFICCSCNYTEVHVFQLLAPSNRLCFKNELANTVQRLSDDTLRLRHTVPPSTEYSFGGYKGATYAICIFSTSSTK